MLKPPRFSRNTHWLMTTLRRSDQDKDCDAEAAVKAVAVPVAVPVARAIEVAPEAAPPPKVVVPMAFAALDHEAFMLLPDNAVVRFTVESTYIQVRKSDLALPIFVDSDTLKLVCNKSISVGELQYVHELKREIESFVFQGTKSRLLVNFIRLL